MSKKKKKKVFDAISVLNSQIPVQEKTSLWNQCFQKKPTDFYKTEKDGKRIALDASVTNKLTSCFEANLNLDPVLYAYFMKNKFIGYQACSMLMTNWLISKACRLPPEDAIAPDWKIVLENDDDKETSEKTEELKKLKYLSEKKYKIREKCLSFCTNNRIFGVAYALPIIDGIDYSAPFNIDGVEKGSYHGMKVIDPVWVMPEFNQSSVLNPKDMNFYEPTYYRLINSDPIHESHIVKIIYAPVTDILKPSYYFGGVPLPQLLYQRVFNAESIANEAVMLCKSKRLLVVDGDLASYVASQGEMEPLLNGLTELRDNWGVLFKNPDDEVKQVDTSLADFPEVMAGQYQLVASTAQMTYEKLLGTAPKGMNASGEFSYKDYVQTLQGIQQMHATPFIERHTMLSLKSDFGKTYRFNVVFNPIDSPTSKDIAEVSAIKTNTLATLQGINAISSDEVRDVIRQDEYLGLGNISDDIKEDQQEENESNRLIQKDGEKFRMRNPAISPTLQQKEKVKVKANDGGKGSRDFNNKGRKGEVGGSAPKEKKTD